MAEEAKKTQTLGERRVRTTFNPSASGDVDVIKQKSAELIDLLVATARKSEEAQGGMTPGTDGNNAAMSDQEHTDARDDTVEATLRVRGGRYGRFSRQFPLAQALKNVMREWPEWDELPSTVREALDMIQTKVSRIVLGDPLYADNWHDIEGYARLLKGSSHWGDDSAEKPSEIVQRMIKASKENPVLKRANAQALSQDQIAAMADYNKPQGGQYATGIMHPFMRGQP